MRGCDEADIDLVGAVTAEPLEFLFLENPEQLRLKFQRYIAYLVQKKGAFIGKFEASGFCATAPVNAPFSWPNSSLSRSPRGIAAQFSFTNAFWLRLLSLWIARATSSLPVPVSPCISTLESVGATTDTRFNVALNAGLSPTISVNSDRISSSR